jgi:hypothetical protein
MTNGKRSKKMSVIDRCFSAASRYMTTRYGIQGFTERDERHIAYRCGWAAGYRQAQREKEKV